MKKFSIGMKNILIGMKNLPIGMKNLPIGMKEFSLTWKKILFTIMNFRVNEIKEAARLLYIIYKNTLTTSYLFQNFII